MSDLPTYVTCRGRYEVEAESVAYVVAASVGLDTAGYTFAYVAGWAGGDLSLVWRVAETVTAAARTILGRLGAAQREQPPSNRQAATETTSSSDRPGAGPRRAGGTARCLPHGGPAMTQCSATALGPAGDPEAAGPAGEVAPLGEQLAEAAVLRCLLQTTAAYARQVLARLTKQDWSVPQHAHVAHAIRVLLEQGVPVDPVTVLGQLRRQGLENAQTANRDRGGAAARVVPHRTDYRQPLYPHRAGTHLPPTRPDRRTAAPASRRTRLPRRPHRPRRRGTHRHHRRAAAGGRGRADHLTRPAGARTARPGRLRLQDVIDADHRRMPRPTVIVVSLADRAAGSNVLGVSRTTISRASVPVPPTPLRSPGLGFGRRRPVRDAGPGQLSLLAECPDERDRSVLAFARDHHLQGRVGARVERQLGITETRYDQLRVPLLDRPEVAEAEPERVAGLRALQASRQRRRRAAPACPPGTRIP